MARDIWTCYGDAQGVIKRSEEWELGLGYTFRNGQHINSNRKENGGDVFGEKEK